MPHPAPGGAAEKQPVLLKNEYHTYSGLVLVPAIYIGVDQMKINRLVHAFFALMLTMMSVSIANAQGNGDEDPTATIITLNNDTISVEGSGATVDGSNVTITAAGTYRLSGNLTDGQVMVDAKGATVTLILNGVEMRNTTSAPIYIKHAESAVIVLADGSQNFVSDAATYVYANPDDNEPNAAVFSDDDLTINGSGSLTVEANFNDGITSKDSLTITDATITVNAADDGIRGKDSLVVTNAHLTLTTRGDGLKADNEEDPALGTISIANSEIKINAGGDALQAETAAIIDGGLFDLTTAGGSSANISDDLSAKGLKAGISLTINGGTFAINSADDALHANNALTVNGGTFTLATGDDAIHADASVTINGGDINITKSYEGIESEVITINGGTIHLVSSDDGINVAGGNATGGFASVANYYLYIHGGYIVVNADGDGLDANGSIEMTGGVVIVHGPTMNMNGALDYDGTFHITGGFLVAAGSSGMAQAPDQGSSQHSLLLNLDTAQPAGTLIHIQDSNGNDLLTFAPAKSYQSIAFSSPELTDGATYSIYFGGRSDGTVTDGLYGAGTYTSGTQFTDFTVSGIVTQIGRSSRFGRRP